MDESTRQFVRDENIKKFKKQLLAATDQSERKTLLNLLAEEEAKAAAAIDKVEVGRNPT
jgi:hypothetical protein